MVTTGGKSVAVTQKTMTKKSKSVDIKKTQNCKTESRIRNKGQ